MRHFVGMALLLTVLPVSGYAAALYVQPNNGYAVEVFPPQTTTATVAFVADTPGITGAEFRIDGLPDGWIVQVERSPEVSAMSGDPFDGVGVNLAFASCQSERIVHLLTLTITPTTVVSDQLLAIESRTPAGNPDFNCPLVTLCDAPSFTKVCVAGLETCLNPEQIYCGLSVESETWTKVKSMYR